jgi:hypothetical protein
MVFQRLRQKGALAIAAGNESLRVKVVENFLVHLNH